MQNVSPFEYPKPLLLQPFFACVKPKMFFTNITPQISLTFSCQTIFDCLAAFPTLLVKHFFFYCQTSTTCNIFWQQDVPSCALSNDLLVPKCWTITFTAYWISRCSSLVTTTQQEDTHGISITNKTTKLKTKLSFLL